MLRRIVNHLVREGLTHLDDAPPEAMRKAFRVLRWCARRTGVTLPEELDPRLVRSAVGIIGRAIADTPYGHPLQFECPLIVTIAISDYCPFACTNCYSSSGGGAGSRATEQEPASFERLAASQTPVVLVTGGEPMASNSTRPGIVRLLDSGKAVYVSTNASIEGYLQVAARYPLLMFILPVWGNRTQHDEQRGRRSFERVTENLRMLESVGRKAWLLVVITNDDLSVFDAVEELARTHSVALVRITRKVRVGRNDGPGPEVTPQFVRSVEEGARRLKRYVRNVVIDLPETRGERRLARVAHALGIPHYRSCAAGNWMMHMDARGDAYPCYTFEGGTQGRVSSMTSVVDQWRLVRERRAELGDGDICIGEALATRTEISEARHPLRLVNSGFPREATKRSSA